LCHKLAAPHWSHQASLTELAAPSSLAAPLVAPSLLHCKRGAGQLAWCGQLGSASLVQLARGSQLGASSGAASELGAASKLGAASSVRLTRFS
jgi:hypothetical protein